jgi:hypothetical protein
MYSRVVYEKGYELCTTMWERLDADPIPQMLRGRMVGMGMVMLHIYMQASSASVGGLTNYCQLN